MDATVVFMFMNSKGAFFPGNWKIIPGDKSQNSAAAMRGGAQSFIVHFKESLPKLERTKSK